MKMKSHALALTLTLGLAACAGPKPAASGSAASTPAVDTSYGATTVVKSRDGRGTGEIVGTLVPGSKFAKLQIGMLMSEVTALIGGADGQLSHETGKRWIPFYFANDARRLEVLYKGEGCLTYTGGNAWGSGDNELIRITATTRTDCMD